MKIYIMISWWHSWWKRRAFSANNKSKEHLVLVRKGPGYLAVQNASWTSLSILSKWSVLFIYRIYLYACSVGASLLLCSAEKSMDASLSNLLPPFPFLSRRYKFSCWISFFINVFTKWRTLKIRSIFDESWKRVTSFCYSFALELLDPITTEGTYILRWNRLSKKVWKSISQSIHDNSIRLENHSNSIKSKFRFQFTLFSLLLSLILYWSKYVHIYLPSFSYYFLF